LLQTAPDERLSRPAPSPTPDVSAALRRAYQLLDQLHPDERIAFALRYVQGMTLEEVAEVCAVSLSTAKRRLSRANDHFRALCVKEPLLKEWVT
jgi:RNA polymerase sigma-70 factor (ECF subfamily)